MYIKSTPVSWSININIIYNIHLYMAINFYVLYNCLAKKLQELLKGKQI